MGGDIYRVGARQGATPPSTPVHEVDSGQGSSGPETYIYTSRRGPSPCYRPGRPRAHASQRTAPSSTPATGARGRPGCLWDPRTAAPGPLTAQRLRPFSLIPSPPRRLPSVHLLLPTGECSGPTETGAPRPPSPLPLRQGRTPWSPLPIGTHAHDEIPLAHRASRQRPIKAPGQGPGRSACHAMLDGRLGGPGPCSVARCQATVTLPLRCAARDSTPAHHAPAQSLPSCHAIPSHPPHRPSRTTPIQTHRPPLASNRACKRSAVPTRFSGGHTNAHKVGHHRPASQPSPPLPSLAANWREQEPCLPRGPGSTTRHRPSHPLPSNAANWQRAGHIEIAPAGTYQGTSKGPAAPSATPGFIPRPSISPARAQARRRRPAATQALRLALSGKGPRPVHPANWRRVLDVESRPSSTCDARGRSLGVSPPPSARRCRGTLMGRCVLHKSSQGSG